jgi:hypothetical protein
MKPIFQGGKPLDPDFFAASVTVAAGAGALVAGVPGALIGAGGAILGSLLAAGAYDALGGGTNEEVSDGDE